MGDKHSSPIPVDLDLSTPQQDCCSNLEELALAYKALSHPVRLMILSKIGKQNSRCCGDICSSLPLAQSTVSQHLKVLRECGFIELETAGQQSHYRVNHQKVHWLMTANRGFFANLSPQDLSE